MRWLMRFLQRTPPPERSTSDAPARDPAYYEARERYQRQKAQAMQKQIELLARINRLGYDFDIAARRHDNDASD